LSHTHQLSKLDEDQKGLATDTAASAEKQPDVKQRKLVKSSALDAAKATPLPAQRPTSSEQLVPPEDVDDASNKMSPTSLFSESEPEYTQEQVHLSLCMVTWGLVAVYDFDKKRCFVYGCIQEGVQPTSETCEMQQSHEI